MKTFTILYRWAGREYETTMPGRDAVQAMAIASLQLMNGAKMYGVEVTR